jgi:endogenous inhibitor of DNA gyrase (YacG/DUF329 family)
MERVCPTCKRPLSGESASAAYRPFCSQRCRLADLGSWLNGSYRISRPAAEEELDEGLPPGVSGSGSEDDGRN